MKGSRESILNVVCRLLHAIWTYIHTDGNLLDGGKECEEFSPAFCPPTIFSSDEKKFLVLLHNMHLFWRPTCVPQLRCKRLAVFLYFFVPLNFLCLVIPVTKIIYGGARMHFFLDMCGNEFQRMTYAVVNSTSLKFYLQTTKSTNIAYLHILGNFET